MRNEKEIEILKSLTSQQRLHITFDLMDFAKASRKAGEQWLRKREAQKK